MVPNNWSITPRTEGKWVWKSQSLDTEGQVLSPLTGTWCCPGHLHLLMSKVRLASPYSIWITCEWQMQDLLMPERAGKSISVEELCLAQQSWKEKAELGTIKRHHQKSKASENSKMGKIMCYLYLIHSQILLLDPTVTKCQLNCLCGMKNTGQTLVTASLYLLRCSTGQVR